MSTVLHPSPSELQALINTETKLLVLNFSAAWCGPCKASAPHVESFAARHPEVVVVKIDVDEHPEVASRFLIRSVPTFIALQDGLVKQVHTGGASAAQLERLI